MEEYDKIVQEEHQYKAKLFQFPDWQKPTAIFDFEDLENDEVLLVLCARAKLGDDKRAEDICFVWHGSEHDVSPDEQQQFVQQCIGVYYGSAAADNIKVLQEHSADESAEFMQFFESQEFMHSF